MGRALRRSGAVPRIANGDLEDGTPGQPDPSTIFDPEICVDKRGGVGISFLTEE